MSGAGAATLTDISGNRRWVFMGGKRWWIDEIALACITIQDHRPGGVACPVGLVHPACRALAHRDMPDVS
jgi:hypothetical protein